jgi:hypothetical protein
MSEITREELVIGSFPGTHRTLTPFVGFKAIRCQTKSFMPWGEPRTFSAIATVEVPIDETIVRSRPCYSDSFGDRMCYISDKLRTSQFRVLDIHNKMGIEVSSDCNCFSIHDNDFKYKKGELHQPDKFNSSVTEECASGLHFFQTKDEAMKYQL